MCEKYVHGQVIPEYEIQDFGTYEIKLIIEQLIEHLNLVMVRNGDYGILLLKDKEAGG